MSERLNIDKVDFTKLDGLICAIAQDYRSKEILMVAFMNREALEITVKTGRAVYFSRSRGKLWHKGEESGNYQDVKEILIDCDQDAIVLLVDQIGGAACHTGMNTCFYRRINRSGEFEDTGKIPLFDPAQVYKK